MPANPEQMSPSVIESNALKGETNQMLLIDKLLFKLNKNISKIDNVAKESRNLVNKTTLTLNSGKVAHAAMYSGLIQQLNMITEGLGTISPKGHGTGYPVIDLARSTLTVPNMASTIDTN